MTVEGQIERTVARVLMGAGRYEETPEGYQWQREDAAAVAEAVATHEGDLAAAIRAALSTSGLHDATQPEDLELIEADTLAIVDELTARGLV